MNVIKVLIVITVSVFGLSCNHQDRIIPDVSDFASIQLDTVQLQLNKLIEETSGLVKIDSTFWTHNDSGGQPALYQFDPVTGEIERTVYVNQAKNVDWEDLTHDDQYVYVGNFGNNFGNRKNLGIYKVSIESMMTNDQVDAELITFSYPDQEKFYSGYNHNHDCESMIAYGDSLYLFSKNWKDKQTKLYSLPKSPGDYSAKLLSSYDVRGTLTGATLSDSLDRLFLLGYNAGDGFDPFVWTISDWLGTDFLSGDKERVNILNRRQTEGILMSDDETLYISAEHEGGGYPILLQMKVQ